MYPVSDAYREKLMSNTVEAEWYGLIRTTIGMEYRIDYDVLKEGSGKITRLICSSKDLEIGSTCSAQLDLSLYLPDLSRYELYMATVTMQYRLKLGEGLWEEIPGGVYYITEPPKRDLDLIKFSAYDAMSKFNKDFGQVLQGNTYSMLAWVCSYCEVELGTTQEEMANFVNGTVDTYVYEEVEVQTCRDLVGQIASYHCCFAFIGPDNKLYLKPYRMTADRTIGAGDRFKYTPQDYETYYTALEAYFKVAEEYELVQQGAGGLTYELGTNALIQFNADELRLSVLTNILTKLAEVSYTPFSAEMPCDPSIMVGDVLNFTDNHAVDGKLSAVTKQVIRLGGKMTLECAGTDPNLNVLTKREKQLVTAAHNSNKDGMYYYDYLNTEPLTIRDGREAMIILLEYVTKKETHIDFHAEIKMSVETTESYDEGSDTYTEHDGVIHVTYLQGGNEIREYYPVNTFLGGTHLLHLLYTWWASANILSNFEVRIRCEGCSITVEAGAARGYIAGTGLVGDISWDGAVYVYDQFEPVDFKTIRKQFTDEVEVRWPTRNDDSVAQTAGKVNFFSKMMKRFTELLGAHGLHRYSVPYNNNDVTKIGAIAVGSVWACETNDDGYVITPARPVDKILKLTSLHTSNTGDVTYLISVDEGTTWKFYATGWQNWLSGHGMAEPVMAAITESQWAEVIPEEGGTIMVQAILHGDATLSDIQIYTEVYQ